MQDSWEAGDPYEYYMGRWSRRVAGGFVDWLPTSPGLAWLDVGCGSGALSEAVIRRHSPASLTAVDQSRGFVEAAQSRLGERALCRVGNALSLPLDDASVDVVVSGLVLNFIPEPDIALAEMSRVTRPGGVVALYVWDYAGRMEFLRYFWDAAVEVEPSAVDLHEGTRFPTCTAETLETLCGSAGLQNVETAPIEISTRFADFDDFWKPFLGGQGPGPTFVSALELPARERLRDMLASRLPVQSDGSIPLRARAWAVRGRVAA